MSDLSLNFLSKVGSYSIFFYLAAPLYIFLTDNYKDNYKLAIAILILCVVVTTYFYWGRDKEKYGIWRYLDRLVASSIIVLAFIKADKYARGFLGASLYFFFIGQSGSFKNYNSYINHVAFRTFAGLGLISYITSDNLTYQTIFVVLNVVFSIFLIYLNIKKLKLSVEFDKNENITENSLIF